MISSYGLHILSNHTRRLVSPGGDTPDQRRLMRLLAVHIAQLHPSLWDTARERAIVIAEQSPAHCLALDLHALTKEVPSGQ